MAFEVSLGALRVVAFDFSSDLAAGSRSNLGHSPDSNSPNMDYFADRTNIVVAVSWAVEEGLRNDGEMENCDH